jgi:cytochrome c-type biogenesis protein CcmH/NrfF
VSLPATSRTEKNISRVHQIVCKNCLLTVRSISEQANIDRETVRKILTHWGPELQICDFMVQRWGAVHAPLRF